MIRYNLTKVKERTTAYKSHKQYCTAYLSPSFLLTTKPTDQLLCPHDFHFCQLNIILKTLKISTWKFNADGINAQNECAVYFKFQADFFYKNSLFSV